MVEDRTLRRLVSDWLPDRPMFNLAVEPWIDVVAPDGTDPRRVGLGDLLTHGHELRLDASARGWLWAHAAHRMLIAFTYLIRAHQPDYPWDQVAAGRRPLPTEAINATLKRFADHLWLHHPATPFLQELSVLDLMSGRSHKNVETAVHNCTDPFWAMLPDVPSKTNTAWFGRADERETPDAADAACALLIRHYFALPGNEAPNRVSGGKTSKGGATGLTHRGRSFVTVAAPTLAATLARNLLSAWIDVVEWETPTFFEQPQELARNVQPVNALWVYTASLAATVLIPVPDDPDAFRVVRTPAPFSKEATHSLADIMAANDPHALRVDPKTAGQPFSHVSLTTAGSDLDLVRRFYRDLVNQSALHPPTVLEPHALAYGTPGSDVDVLVIDGAGSSMGPRVAATASFVPPTGTLTIDPLRASRYLEIADKISFASGSASRKVAWHVYLVLSPDRAAPKPPWLNQICDERLASAVENVLLQVLKLCADPAKQLPAAIDDAQKNLVRDATLDVFDRLVAPHAVRPATVRHVVRQRHALIRDLARLWS